MNPIQQMHFNRTLNDALVSFYLGKKVEKASWFRRLVAKAKARASLFFLVVLTSCVPAKPTQTPTALQLATGAVVLTDEALALAIEANPSEAWKPYLVALEGVADAVRKNEDLCAGPLGTLATVASVAKCTRCLQLVDVLEGQLACRK